MPWFDIHRLIYHVSPTVPDRATTTMPLCRLLLMFSAIGL